MKFATITSLLLGTVYAAPGLENPQRRAVCNRDNCYRALFGTRNVGQNARGSADCLSYFGSTVSLAPATVTTTSTVTIITGTTTIASSTVATVTSASITLPTVTLTTITTALTTQTPTVTTLSSVTSTVTVTVTVPLLFLDKRRLNGRDTTTSTVTTAANGIPAYASYCSGVVRYSSACACGLAVTSTNTVVLPTSTVTRTVIVTISAQATVSTTVVSTTTTVQTSTQAQTLTLTSTVTSTTTVEPTIITIIGGTITTTVTITSTSTPIPSTTSTSSTSTTTTGIIVIPTFVACDFNAASLDPTAGGCSTNCGCDPIGSRGQAFCNVLPVILGQGCTSDSTCPAGQFCDTDVGQCLDGSTCTSTFVPV